MRRFKHASSASTGPTQRVSSPRWLPISPWPLLATPGTATLRPGAPLPSPGRSRSCIMVMQSTRRERLPLARRAERMTWTWTWTRTERLTWMTATIVSTGRQRVWSSERCDSERLQGTGLIPNSSDLQKRNETQPSYWEGAVPKWSGTT